MPNDDYILRGDAVFELYRYASAKDPALMIAYRVDLYERIEKIHAADVEPVKMWIPVTERLPKSAERYLVMRFDYVAKAPFYDLLWFENGRWWNRHFEGDYAVTHWMPLPEPPKEEKEDPHD